MEAKHKQCNGCSKCSQKVERKEESAWHAVRSAFNLPVNFLADFKPLAGLDRKHQWTENSSGARSPSAFDPHGFVRFPYRNPLPLLLLIHRFPSLFLIHNMSFYLQSGLRLAPPSAREEAQKERHNSKKKKTARKQLARDARTGGCQQAFPVGEPLQKKLFNLVKYHSVVFLCNFFVFLMFLMKTGSVCVFVSFMFCSRVSDIGNRPFLARQECGSTVSLYGEHGSWEHVWTKVWRIIFFGGGFSKLRASLFSTVPRHCTPGALWLSYLWGKRPFKMVQKFVPSPSAPVIFFPSKA